MVNMVSWRGEKCQIDRFHSLQDNKFAGESKANTVCSKDLTDKPAGCLVNGQPVTEPASSPAFTLIKVFLQSPTATLTPASKDFYLISGC